MALELKLSFEGVDSSGRVLNLKDATGAYNASTNPGGWGSPNTSPSSITLLRLEVSGVLNKKSYYQDYEAPEFNLQDIALGNTIMVVSSMSLGKTALGKPIVAFNDGVYDFNYYAVLGNVSGVSGIKGQTIITGTSMINYYGYDNIYINGTMYTIDKNLLNLGANILPLVEPLKENVANFRPVFRANVKGMVQTESDMLLMAMAGKVADQGKCGNTKPLMTVLESLGMKTAAQMNFDQADYINADCNLRTAVGVISKSKC